MNGSLVLVKSARALAVRNPHSLSVCSAAAPSATRAYHQHHQRTAVLRALGRGDQTTLGPLTRRQGWPQKQLYSSDAQKGVLSPKYASRVKSLFKWFLPQYQGQAIGKAVYERCSTYPDFELFWVKECQLPETFQTWFSTTSLYVWMAMVRIRADPDAKHYNQGLIDAFFRDTEAKIRKSGVKSSRIVNDTLKDLVSSFKGTVMSLDEGFAGSDAVLAAAIWRNVVPVDEAIVQIDAATSYVRRQLQILDKCEIADITSGSFAFEPVHLASNKTGSAEA